MIPMIKGEGIKSTKRLLLVSQRCKILRTKPKPQISAVSVWFPHPCALADITNPSQHCLKSDAESDSLSTQSYRPLLPIIRVSTGDKASCPSQE